MTWGHAVKCSVVAGIGSAVFGYGSALIVRHPLANALAGVAGGIIALKYFGGK